MRVFPLALLLCGTPALAAAPVEGLWLTQNGKGVVRIGPCGQQMCGWVARVAATGPEVPTRDVRNPDLRLRSRPIVGIQVLTGLNGSGGDWRGGRGYDPESGRNYEADVVRLNRDGSLRVTGCIWIRIIVRSRVCRNYRWTRTR